MLQIPNMENVHISLDQSNGRDANQIERGSEKISKETTQEHLNNMTDR